MVPLHTIFPFTVQPEEKSSKLSTLRLQPGDQTFTSKFIGRTEFRFFLEDVLAIVTDSHLGSFDFRHLSLVNRVGFSIIFKLTSLRWLHGLSEDGSTDVNLGQTLLAC